MVCSIPHATLPVTTPAVNVRNPTSKASVMLLSILLFCAAPRIYIVLKFLNLNLKLIQCGFTFFLFDEKIHQSSIASLSQLLCIKSFSIIRFLVIILHDLPEQLPFPIHYLTNSFPFGFDQSLDEVPFFGIGAWCQFQRGPYVNSASFILFCLIQTAIQIFFCLSCTFSLEGSISFPFSEKLRISLCFDRILSLFIGNPTLILSLEKIFLYCGFSLSISRCMNASGKRMH